MRLALFEPGTSRRWTALRRIWVAAAALTAAVLVASCQSQQSTASGAADSGNQQVTVGVVPGIDSAPLDVSLQKGIFRQHGVSVTIRTYSTLSSEIAALTSHRIDVAEGDYAGFLSQQTPLKLIADGYDAAPNMVEVLTNNPHITSPQNLQNVTVATPLPQAIKVHSSSLTSGNIPYSIEMLAAESVLDSDGVSPSSVKWDPMPMQKMISALKNGSVNAILVTEPYILQAEMQLGATEVLDACSGVTAGLPLDGYFSLKSFASQNASVLRAFKTALIAGQSASAMRSPVQAVLPHSTGVSTEDAALVTLGTYPSFVNVGQVQRVAQLIYDAGITPNLVNVKAMVFH